MRSLFLALGLSFVAVAGAAAALTPDQLNAKERQRYDSLSDDDAKQRFLRTRDFVRQSMDVMKGKSAAVNLPDQPADFDKGALFPGEQTQVDQAIKRSLAAIAKSLFG